MRLRRLLEGVRCRGQAYCFRAKPLEAQGPFPGVDDNGDVGRCLLWQSLRPRCLLCGADYEQDWYAWFIPSSRSSSNFNVFWRLCLKWRFRKCAPNHLQAFVPDAFGIASCHVARCMARLRTENAFCWRGRTSPSVCHWQSGTRPPGDFFHQSLHQEDMRILVVERLAPMFDCSAKRMGRTPWTGSFPFSGMQSCTPRTRSC